MIAKRHTRWFFTLLVLAAFSLPAAVIGQKEKAKPRGPGKAGEVAKKDKGEKRGEDPEKAARPPRPGGGDEAAPGHEGRGQGPGDHGRGLAMGKDKEKGEGLALGRDRDTSADDGEDAREARRARHLERIKARREVLDKDLKHKEKLKAAMERKGETAKEQRKHLKRMARIRRLLALAAEEKKQALGVKLRGLYKQERERHLRAMNALKERGEKAGK